MLSFSHEQGITTRQIMGSDRTPVATRAAKTEGRAPASAGPEGTYGHPVRSAQWYPLGDATPGDGLWKRHDLLAKTEGLAEGRGVAQTAPGAPRPFRRGGQDRLGTGLARFSECTRPRGGEKTGPNPTDRGKSGTKRHIVVDRQGIPLAAKLSGANVHDSMMFEEMVDSIEPIRRPRGRPRQRPAPRDDKRPDKLHADKGYDFAKCRRALRARGIKGRIARRGIDSKERLGRHRWVVERTLSWFSRYRRLKVRYERRDDVHQAFLDLSCALICWRFIERFC